MASNVLHMQHTKMLHAPCNTNYTQPYATFNYTQAMQHMQHVACVASVAATLLHVADSCNKTIHTALLGILGLGFGLGFNISTRNFRAICVIYFPKKMPKT